MMANFNLPLRAVRMHVASAVNLIVHIRRTTTVFVVCRTSPRLPARKRHHHHAIFTFQSTATAPMAPLAGRSVGPSAADFLARAARFSLGKGYLMPLSWGHLKYLKDPFAAFGSTILFRVALIWALRFQRRRAIIEPRLSNFRGNIERGKRRCVLRRPRAGIRRCRRLLRFDNTRAATGNQIGYRMIATAIITW